jgi:hypothetical protein
VAPGIGFASESLQTHALARRNEPGAAIAMPRHALQAAAGATGQPPPFCLMIAVRCFPMPLARLRASL